jgi:hypothetical protein
VRAFSVNSSNPPSRSLPDDNSRHPTSPDSRLTRLPQRLSPAPKLFVEFGASRTSSIAQPFRPRARQQRAIRARNARKGYQPRPASAGRSSTAGADAETVMSGACHGLCLSQHPGYAPLRQLPSGRMPRRRTSAIIPYGCPNRGGPGASFRLRLRIRKPRGTFWRRWRTALYV